MDTKREEQTRAELAKVGMRPITVKGIRGSEHREDRRLSAVGRHLCTDKMIGCALAHHNAAQRIIRDGHTMALVLEDDVIIKSRDLRSDLENVIANLPVRWDILTLYCQGLCFQGDVLRLGNGSTAAYLISREGALKVVQTKVSYHVDWTRNSLLFNKTIGPNLFSTRDIRKWPLIGDQSLNFWFRQDIARFGPIRLTVARYALILFSVIGLLVGFRHQIARPFLLNAFIALGVFHVVWIYYFSYEVQFYRCSRGTHIYRILFPLVVLISQGYIAHERVRLGIVGLAYSLLFFHLFYQLDG